MSDDDKTIEVALTGRRPVEIVEADWPLIATATWDDDSKNVDQWVRRASLRVREQRDHTGISRYLVYGWKESKFEGESDTSAGVLVDYGEDEALAASILDVALSLNHTALGQSCIEDLPAERI